MSPLAALTLLLFGALLVFALLAWSLVAPPPQSATPSPRPRPTKAARPSPAHARQAAIAPESAPSPKENGRPNPGGRVGRRSEEPNDAFERFLRSSDHER